MTRIVLVLLALLAVPSVAVAAPTPFTPVAPLHPDGRFMKDALGRVVPVRGLFAKWKQKGDAPRSVTGDQPTDQGNPNSSFGPRDAELVAGLGSTAFRLPWFWEALQPEAPPAPLHLEYIDRVRSVERDLGKAGVFSIVDAHQDLYGRRYEQAAAGPNGRIDSPGMPDWATIDDGVPQPISLGFPTNYFLPGTSHAFDSLWLDRNGILSAFADAWKVVAKQFAGEEHVLAYDLLNEPWAGTQYPSCAQPGGCPQFDAALLQPAMEKLAQAVHASDPTRLALFEPHLLFNVGVPTYLGASYAATGLPAGVAPAGASYHDQCITRGALGPAAAYAKDPVTQLSEVLKPGCSVIDGQVMDRGRALGDALGGPAIMTELQPTFSEDSAGIECIIEKAEARMAGYTYGLSWSPRPNDATELRDMFAARPQAGDPRAADITGARAKAMVLARTAPVAIAGAPQGWGFDPRTGAFSLSFTPTAGGATTIFVPERQYPAGYELTAHPGLEAPDERRIEGGVLLAFRTAAGATTASVQITRPAGAAAPADLPALPACTADVRADGR